MDRCGAWRFINPPQSLIRGVLVGADAQRLGNEELYGAALGKLIAEKGGGRGILVIDERIRRQIVAELVAWKKVNFQSVFAVVNLYVNRKRARTVEELARACGLPEAALRATIEEYNRRVREGASDAFGKSAKVRQPIDEPPYYGIRCDLASRLFPTPCFTIGGLRVDEPTGRVLREDDTPIDGLYAAGRTAVGISSHSYVSGLSIADGIFSGRRAARDAVAAAQRDSQGSA
jgi:3-oxo-5alpha-steroid 4-dehydrogenase